MNILIGVDVEVWVIRRYHCTGTVTVPFTKLDIEHKGKLLFVEWSLTDYILYFYY